MSVKLTDEQLRTALAALRAVPKDQIRNIGKLRFYPDGRVGVVAKDPTLIGKVADVPPIVRAVGEFGDVTGERFAERVRQIPFYLRNDPYGEADISPRNERRSGRVFRRLQHGDQNVAVRNEQVFNGLIIRYNQMLDQIAGSGRVTNQNRQDLWRLYQELVSSEQAVNNRFARRNRGVSSVTTGQRRGLGLEPLGQFQARSLGAVPVAVEESRSLFLNQVNPSIPANSLILNSSLRVQVVRVSQPAQIWVYGSQNLLPPTSVPNWLEWLNFLMTPRSRSQLVGSWSLRPGMTLDVSFANQLPAQPAFLNRNRRQLVDSNWTNLMGFMFLTDAAPNVRANLTLTVDYLPPLDLKNFGLTQ